MTAIVVTFVLIALLAAFIGGAFVCYRFFEPEIAAGERAPAETQAKLDALEASYRIAVAAWESERAMFQEALRVDRKTDPS